MQIYYARGNEVNDSKYESFIDSLKTAYEIQAEEDCNVVMHDRSKSIYNPQLLKDSDCIVMITAFPFEERLKIGVGLYREMHEAGLNDIPVYVLKKTSSGLEFLAKVDDTMLTVIDETIWTAGYAIIDLELSDNSWDVHNGFNMKNFWRVQKEYYGFNPKPKNKEENIQNKDSRRRTLLLG